MKKGLLIYKLLFRKEYFPDIEIPNVSSDANKIEVYGISVYVFEQSEELTIVYQEGLTQYIIDFPFEKDVAIEFTKSIK